jgi:PUA domain protein
MPTKQRRYPLKAKEAKQILEQASKKLRLDLDQLFGAGANVEVVESDVGEIYLIEGKPVLYKVGDGVLPTLLFGEFVAKAPKIVVDMGAIPYVCKGATVMAPGIVRIDGEFGKGDIVIVVDMKHGKALALGESLLDADAAKTTKKDLVTKLSHYKTKFGTT